MTWLLVAVFVAEIAVMIWGFRRQARRMREHEDNPRHHMPRPF